MTKVLYVGDPHVQIKNLYDSKNLVDYIIKLAGEQDVDQITFLGDMFHTHAVVRIEVINFWKKALLDISSLGKNIVCLVGNHDQPGSKEKEQEMNALIALEDLDIYIADKPYFDPDTNISYVPYHSNHELFLNACKELYDQGGKGMLIAHQTFTGAQYENGFFSQDGLDPALVPQEEIISGHIHKSQQVGKCFYPGTPKWDTMSDANQPKGLYIIDHGDDGTIRNKKWFSTEDIVTPIKSYEVKEGDELPDLKENARNYVVLEGKSAWITRIKKKIKGLANVKVKPTDRAVRVDKKNSSSIEDYLEKEFEPIAGVTKDQLAEFLRDI